jgi:uncharacterized protein YbjT (DUF2867 family)
MQVFLTGATGFVGSAIIEELRAGGHQVTGLARSDQAAATLAQWGVAVRRGDVSEPDGLAQAARASDGVIHCAFGHDFSRYVEMGEVDLRAVSAMAQALAGSGKPLVVTSGMTASTPGRLATESDAAQTEGMAAVRGRPEAMALGASEMGVRSLVVRLPPSVHDLQAQGLVSQLIAVARQTGVSAYVGEGANRWPAVHRRDAARLFRARTRPSRRAAPRGCGGRRHAALHCRGHRPKARYRDPQPRRQRSGHSLWVAWARRLKRCSSLKRRHATKRWLAPNPGRPAGRAPGRVPVLNPGGRPRPGREQTGRRELSSRLKVRTRRARSRRARPLGVPGRGRRWSGGSG